MNFYISLKIILKIRMILLMKLKEYVSCYVLYICDVFIDFNKYNEWIVYRF